MFSLWWAIKTNYTKQVEKGSRPTLGTAPQAVAHGWHCLGTACLEQDCESVCDSAMLHIRFHSSIQTNKQTTKPTASLPRNLSTFTPVFSWQTQPACTHCFYMTAAIPKLYFCLWGCTGVHMYTSSEDNSVSVSGMCPPPLRQGLSLTWSPPIRLVWLAREDQGSSCLYLSPTPQSWEFHMRHCAWPFLSKCWRSNLGPDACETSTLVSVFFLQALVFFFGCSCSGAGHSMHPPENTCENQRTTSGRQFPPSSMWVLGLELQLSGLSAST